MQFKKPKPLNYEQTVRFHGHDGPFLALGYRLGRYLTKQLRPRGIMGLEIAARMRKQKPYTCLLDGLQCSTFATLGKGNIRVENIAREHIVVKARVGKRSLTCTITEQAWNTCFTALDLRKAARKIMRMPISELWHMQK